jgi:hypothetical protein
MVTRDIDRSSPSKYISHDPDTGNFSRPAVGQDSMVASGKPPLGPKAKIGPKITATHSEPHLPVALADAPLHKETQNFQLANAHIFDRKVFAACPLKCCLTTPFLSINLQKLGKNLSPFAYSNISFIAMKLLIWI